MDMRVRSLTLLAALWLAWEAIVHGAPGAIDFNRDVRPIVSQNCNACHGPDREKRKANLRLDEEPGSRSELKDGKHAIVPGHPEQSELIARVTTQDEDDVMPPRKTNKKLSANQIEKLRAWIAGGARYAKHWSLIKPERPALPIVRNPSWARNPIDLF